MTQSLEHAAEASAEARFGRRQFVNIVMVATGMVALSRLLSGCGADRAAAPAPTEGTVRGTVVDAQGNPQAVGRIYLLLPSGENQDVYADVDAHGGFNFGAVAVGSYQLRYWGGAQAAVPEPNPNPVRITVHANSESVVQFSIVLGNPDAKVKEIYAGDNFYQEQPFGDLNATVTVPLGTVVCWYNVGVQAHTVTGGPWGDSGIIAEADEFMWTANQTGTFGYRCSFHNPQMQAILKVV